MGDIFLDDPVYALGEMTATLAESAADGRLASDPAALAEAGFARHHLCGPGTSVVDLAERCLAGMAGPPRADLLIFATALTASGNLGDADAFAATGDVRHLMDFPASRLQQRLGLPDAAVVGLNQQACTATLGALRLARGLLAAEPDLDDILCVSADRFPEGARYEQSWCLISDGAAGFRVSRRGGRWRVLGCHQLTNGALATATADETVGAFFAHTYRLVGETAARAGVAVAAIDWIVPQNMHGAAWPLTAHLLGLDEARLAPDSTAENGHVIAADPIINLRRLQDSGRLMPGQLVLLAMAGFGMNWQAALLQVMP